MLYENRTNSSVEDIACVIGYTATCTLIEWYGGTNLWIPVAGTETHEIGRIIGLPAFRALCREYGATCLRVPTDHFRDQMRQDRAVARMIQFGHGAKSIGAAIGLTPRQVQNIRRRLEEAGVLSPLPEVRM